MAESAEGGKPFLVYRDRIELRDFIAYMTILGRLPISKLTRRATWLVALLLVLVAIVALLLNVAIWEALFLLTLGGYVVTMPIHYPLYLRWQYRRVKSLLPETDVTADEVGVRAKSVLADVSYRWEAIRLAVDSPDGILLCNELRQALMWFPQRALLTGGSKEDVLATSARHGAKVIRMNGV
jgi:hypothetical protein